MKSSDVVTLTTFQVKCVEALLCFPNEMAGAQEIAALLKTSSIAVSSALRALLYRKHDAQNLVEDIYGSHNGLIGALNGKDRWTGKTWFLKPRLKAAIENKTVEAVNQYNITKGS